MRRDRSFRLDSTSSADCLPSIARLSSDSSTGSRDCASSRVKVFMGNALFIGYDKSKEQGVGNREQARAIAFET